MQNRKFGVPEIILSAIALGLVISIFLKAVINLDTGYDAGWYHLPFAARIWGIIPKDSFITEKSIEYRYEGFPLLAHFFQGFLWKTTGRIQATNLVGYFSLMIYIFFLHSFFKVPFYISTIALFTIPAVLTHATTSFVDLPGNIGVSVVVMMIYRFFSKSEFPNRKELLAAFMGAAVAANTKPQLTVLAFLLWFAIAIRLLWLYSKHTNSDKRKLWLTIPLATLASILIFATPIKNVALHANPLYPIKVEVAGVVLNHRATPKTYTEGNRPQKWLRSVLEINTPEWTADQFNYSGDPKNLDRAGGFFGAYVVFNLLLLVIFSFMEYRQGEKLLKRNTDKAFIALAIIIISSVFVANFPQSHELRYFMFWMIVLVSLNLSIIWSMNIKLPKWLQVKRSALIYLIFLFVMCIKIDNYYLRPIFTSIPNPPKGYTSAEEYVKDAVKPELVERMIPNQRVCLISRHAIPNPEAVPFASIANAIFYTSYFHPKVKYDYSIKAVTRKSSCGNLPIIP